MSSGRESKAIRFGGYRPRTRRGPAGRPQMTLHGPHCELQRRYCLPLVFHPGVIFHDEDQRTM